MTNFCTCTNLAEEAVTIKAKNVRSIGCLPGKVNIIVHLWSPRTDSMWSITCVPDDGHFG